MAFWKGAGYSHHVLDQDDCHCPSCKQERELLAAAQAGTFGGSQPITQLPVYKLGGRPLIPSRQIGYVDPIDAFNPLVVKTFAVSTASKLSEWDKEADILDNKVVVHAKIQRRIHEILSRLNYLSSKNGLSFHDFKMSIQQDLVSETALESEIKVLEEAEAAAEEAACFFETEAGIYGPVHGQADQLIELRPISAMVPQPGYNFVPCPHEEGFEEDQSNTTDSEDSAWSGLRAERNNQDGGSAEAGRCGSDMTLASSFSGWSTAPQSDSDMELPLDLPSKKVTKVDDCESLADDSSIMSIEHKSEPRPPVSARRTQRLLPLNSLSANSAADYGPRPGTAETLAFLSNPPKLDDDVCEAKMAEINSYYRRAMQVAQTFEAFD